MTVQSFVARSAESQLPFELLHTMGERVAMGYSEAISSLVLAAADASNPAARDVLWRAATRLRAQAETHEALRPLEPDAMVNLSEYVAEVCRVLTRDLLRERGVRLALEVEDLRVPALRGWRIALILAELVRDAAHGRQSRDHAPIAIRLGGQDGRIECLLCDPGAREAIVGPAGVKGIVASLVGALGGTLETWSRPGGCVVRLQVSARPPVDTRLSSKGRHAS